MSRIPLPGLRARDAGESHRNAVPLELFFDLVFVVAVALASQNLHYFESDDHFNTGIVRYLMVFFAIWWAWMNFTWFASAYDSDDWLYRLLTLVQMAGALIMAAGVPEAMNDNRYPIIIAGYMVMRLALVVQWLRAAAGDPERRVTALTYAAGIAVVQVWWSLNLFVPDGWTDAVYIIGVAAELTIPVIAERKAVTPWHPHHITERFGLFTLIVLGESILASSNSIVEGIDVGDRTFEMLRLAISGFAIVAAMWWLYFAYPQRGHLRTFRMTFRWGYSHYFIFASAAAVSAGIEVAVDYNTDRTSLSAAKAAAALCVPVAVFVMAVWFPMIRPNADRVVNVAIPAVAGLVLVAVFLPYSLQLAAMLMIALVALITVRTNGALDRAPATGI
ncbi:MAG: low temperature requirement protein A [Chloroflexota bacterium]|nr:low temperature requirement protein A [Chloroflexota bacterium]